MTASLDEILAKGSHSFRRLNSSTPGKVSAAPAGKTRAAGVLAAAVSNTERKSDERAPLVDLPKTPRRGAEVFTRRPRVEITLFRVQKLDGDQKWGSVKYLLDAIRRAELIPDDTEDDIDLNVTQHHVPKYSMEGTGVVITY